MVTAGVIALGHMMDEDYSIPSGSPHDVAMMAYRLAARAMSLHERHVAECAKRWDQQRVAMDDHFRAAAADRQEFRQTLDRLRAQATSVVLRFGIWAITMLTTGLAGATWWIVTHHGLVP